MLIGDTMSSNSAFQTLDEYINSQPADVQVLLQQVRDAIKEVAPDAQEVISYQMPAFKQGTVLVWYAAFKNHIGFFPKTSVMTEFKDKLAQYKTSKGTIQFPYDKPLPLDLIKEIVLFRLKETQKQT
jgi:uncharacterized protein YdhG (YjbR/CyaY superfamily)